MNENVISELLLEMESSDSDLLQNRDWDPLYLSEIFSEEFFEAVDHWSSNISDVELIGEMEKVERYCPITEDISLEDEVLCNAVEKIEYE